MPPYSVEVVAPSRLHFGMFAFGDCHARQFGGAGVMIDRPGLKLRLAPSDRCAVRGPLADRVRAVLDRLACRWPVGELPPCSIEVVDAPPEHVGLGTGTQLALSVTAGLNAWCGRAPLDAARLAELAGRGGRSAIGTHGFLHGGFLVESGKQPDDLLAPLEHRAPLPAGWRFVLIAPAGPIGLSGEAERTAFRELPPVAPEVTSELRREVCEAMRPAADAGDLARFSRSVYRFGHRAGMCFAARQGGPFAGPRVAKLVESIRALGVEGVGQSSWGPTVFALLESDESARRLVDQLQPHLQSHDTITITPINQGGARIVRREKP